MREYKLKIGDKEYKAELKTITAEFATIIVNNKEYKVELEQLGTKEGSIQMVRPVQRPVSSSEPAKESKSVSSGSGLAGGVTSPLPGLILEILVKEGDQVKAGQDLLIMEAMKMENRIQSPHDGVVKKIFVQQGSNISEGDKLVEVTRPMMTTL